MLLKDFVTNARLSLTGLYPEREAVSIVSALCHEVLGTESYTHIIEPKRIVPDEMLSCLEDYLLRLKAGEPLQYVLGYSDFCGLRFKVTPDVLIPRPETEILCREAIDYALRIQQQRNAAFGDCPSMRAMSRVRILDLCTGSGCIAWTLAMNVPYAETIGVDVSAKALKVAESQEFVAQSDAFCPPVFVQYDVLKGPDAFGGSGALSCSGTSGSMKRNNAAVGDFDIILSNPPYVMESEKKLMNINVLEHEPHLALFVPDDDPLIFYRKIAEFAKKRLLPGGFCMVEINEALGAATRAIFEQENFSGIEIQNDFGAKNRFIKFNKSR